ncbi:MAG: extracellular solute-binding protein [Butyrivibrio sp.]|nr:extracellular solute-binding protein [Butyrivibrio sp.]
MSKRVPALVLAFSLLVGMGACGDHVADKDTPLAYKEIDYTSEPVKITYMTIGDKPTNGQTEAAIDELNKILKKKVNAKLDIYYVGWKDYVANYNKCLETEDLGVDLVCTGADWLDTWPNAMNGRFYPLSEDMLKRYCPRTYENVNAGLWKDCSLDGTIYFIPENEYSQWTNHGFVYRKDLAREAGLQEVDSWEDLTTYFEGVRKNHPEMIPWDVDHGSRILSLGYLMSKRKYVPIYELTTYGLWGAYAENMNKIVCPFYEGKEFVNYARLMKKWNEIGVWRSDVSLAGDNDDEFYNGYVSVVQHHTQNYYTIIKPKVKIAMPDTDVDFYWFGKESGNLMRVSYLHGAMAVSAYSQNPERALMVYDLLRNDPECYRLIRYGIEGVQYELNSEGMMEKPSGYNEAQDGIVTNFWWGRRDELEIQDSTAAWDDYYDLVNSYEHVAIDYPWDEVAFSTPQINSQLAPVVEVLDAYVPVISTGQYEGTADEKVEEMRAELKKAGIEKVTKELQEIRDSD